MSEDLLAAERMLGGAMEALIRSETGPWSEMFHDDGAMEFPFAPPGYPPRLDGKSAIADFIKTYPDHINLKSMTFTGSHYSGDTLIIEMVGEGTSVPAGNDFTMKYVAVITVRDGKFVLYKDYWDPLVGIRAMGGLEALESLGAGGAA